MARSSRRGRGKKKNSTQLIMGGLCLLVVLLAGMLFFKPSARSGTEPQPFNIAQYRQDGSRFASTGNRYILEGKVESIESHGGNRMVSVSMRNNRNERLPLLVLEMNPQPINITRGDTFIFDVSCRTGRSADGNEVKGILVVNEVKAK
ncbi:MAG: hypothetical protein IJB33_05735 [Akkermansia sp.]|nr:hypothetical protein [Akkermansia sp.]MBQ7023163.1 hypothetical protein [Akkermansia sp.]